MRAQRRWVIGAGLAGLVGAAALQAQEPLPAPVYTLKQERPRTGTNIPRDVVFASELPLNRRYGEMSEAEQRKVRSLFEAMPAGDEPPFPIDGLGPVYRAIQKVTERMQVRGDMTLVVRVAPDGEATSVQVLKSPDAEATRAVGSVLMLTRYKPAICAGTPCAMDYPFRISSQLHH